jgi:hypothetical protein
MADRYWVGGSGTWSASSTTNWASSSGGASGASAPTNADNVFFDANSNVGTGSFTVTVSATTPVCADMTVSGLDGAMILSGASVNRSVSIYGNISLAGSFSTTANFLISGFGTQYLTTNGISLYTITMGSSGNLTLAGNCLVTGYSNTAFTHNSGTLTLQSYTLTCGMSFSTTSATRTLAFGTGSIYMAGGYGGTCNFRVSATNLTVTGTPNVTLAQNDVSQSTQDVTFSTGTWTEALSINVTCNLNSNTLKQINGTVKNLTTSGTGSLQGSSISCYGNLTVGSGASSSLVVISMKATSGSKTITTSGMLLDSLTLSGVGGTFTLQDSLTTTTANGGGSVGLTGGTFSANGFNVTCTEFASTGSSTRVLNMGSGTWTLNGSSASPWTISGTNGTVNPNTSTLVFAGSVDKTFTPGGVTYYNVAQGSSTKLTIAGSNTFNSIGNTATTACTIAFTAGTTQTVSGFTASGTAGNLLTLQSTSSGSKWYLSKSSGTVSVGYLSISDCTVNPGANWYAGLNSTNGGNNLGWYFSDPYVVAGQFLDVISFSDE